MSIVSINIADIISKAFALGKSGEELTPEFLLELLKDVPVAKSGGRPKKSAVHSDVESDTEDAPKKRPATKKVITEEMMCRARTFSTKEHVDADTGKLKVFEDRGAENKYGARCTKAHTDGQFCTVHAKDAKFGIWGEDYEGSLRNRIRDEKLGKIRKPKVKGVHSDVESETEDAPKKRTNPKKKASELKEEPKKSMAEELGIADADTEVEEENVTTYLKKEMEGMVWMCDENGYVFGICGETLSAKPIGRLSVKADFKRWLQRPSMLETDEDEE